MSESAMHADQPERWLPIAGFDYYLVSNLGRVRSLARSGKGWGTSGRILKAVPAKGGYLIVTLYQDGRSAKRYVHHLVAKAFIGPRPVGFDVRHGPNGKLDNRASQLCYGTRSENHLDKRRDGTMPCGEAHRWSALTEDEVVEIRMRYTAGGISQAALGREYGITGGNVSDLVRGRTWLHVGGPLVTGLDHGRRSKLTLAQVGDIRRRRGDGESVTALAREYGLDIRTVRNIANGYTWKQMA